MCVAVFFFPNFSKELIIKFMEPFSLFPLMLLVEAGKWRLKQKVK